MSRVWGDEGSTGIASRGDFKKFLLSSLCALCSDCGGGGDGVFGCGDGERVKGYEGEGRFSEKVRQMGAGSCVDCRGELGGEEWIFINGGGFAGDAGGMNEDKREYKDGGHKMGKNVAIGMEEK